jgi:hypothetical protein
LDVSMFLPVDSRPEVILIILIKCWNIAFPGVKVFLDQDDIHFILKIDWTFHKLLSCFQETKIIQLNVKI